MSPFSKVVFDDQQTEIAKVNRANGTLYLNPSIWQSLPEKQREFVLLHEKGHLKLQSADEYRANQYAVSQFAPVKTITNKELGKRIVIMRDILTPREESGFLAEGIAGAVSGITQALPVLGIGSNARIKETQAKAGLIAAQSEADQKKANNTVLIIIATGIILILGLSLFFILRK